MIIIYYYNLLHGIIISALRSLRANENMCVCAYALLIYNYEEELIIIIFMSTIPNIIINTLCNLFCTSPTKLTYYYYFI
jgi:hypothetical protein